MPTNVLRPLLDLPEVADSAAAARGAIDRLLAHPVLRRKSASVSGESALRGARASAALAGAAYPLDEVRAGGVDDPLLSGALRVSAELGALVDTWQRAPRQVLARLHALAAVDLVDSAALGRPSARPQVAARLDGLAGLLIDADPAVPAVVLAAVVQGELLATAAFPGPNGVVARAAFRLTLIARGLDPKGLSVPEVGHLELSAEYAGAADAYASGTAEGVTRWLRHCCAAVGLGAREGLAVCEALVRG